jgi:hypothetical protein
MTDCGSSTNTISDKRENDSKETENTKESFIRWQGRSIQQMGFFNNLLLGLATGLLAFQTQLAFNQKVSLVPCEIVVLVTSILVLFASILVGGSLAWNRLNDFRITAQIARKHEKVARQRKNEEQDNIGEVRRKSEHLGERDDIEKLRRKSERLGERTWNLIQWQATLFVVGGLLLLIATIGRYIS